MAHKKAAGSVKNNRDSRSKRLGVKVFGSQKVFPGMILVRQRGTKFHAGSNVKRVADDSLISLVDGELQFVKKKVRAFTGNLQTRVFLQVIPSEK
jgi:large subunit ribosomal protein L27